jgi:transcriptional regulator with XRE-family HTH domain
MVSCHEHCWHGITSNSVDASGPSKTALELGKEIRRRRLEAKLTQRDLASEVRVSFPHISKIEAGHDVPSDDLLRRIAKATKSDPDQLTLIARRIPADLTDLVLKKRDLAPEFLRSWKRGEIRDEEIRKLLDRAARRR